MAGVREQMEGGTRQQSLVDWEAVDEEIKSVPAEYREVLFHPLKHVVEVFSAPDPQGLMQELRDSYERLGYQLDAVVEGYHTGFARSIQNYSQILHLFQESKEQVDSLKRSLADAAKQLGAQSRYLNSQWCKTVSLESALRLLADIRTVVEVPSRVDAALTARDWPRAVSCLLEGATLLAHEELRRVGALRKLRSDMVSLAGWIQDQMMDELTARIFSGSRASTSAAIAGGAVGLPGASGRMVLGNARAGGGGRGAAVLALSDSSHGTRLRGDLAAGRQAPGWRRKGPEPAYKLVTETLKNSRSASLELRNALTMGSGSLPGPGPGGTATLGGAAATVAASAAGVGAVAGGAAGGGGVGGGDIAVDVNSAMQHVTTRELVACLAQVDGVVEAKQHVEQKAQSEMRVLIRRSMEAFAAQAGVHAGSGEHGVGALIGGGGGVGATSGPSRSPAQRVLAQRLVSYVAGACVQALGRLQHVLQELANAPATTQSSALDVLVTQRQGGEGLGGGGGGSGGARESLRDGLLRRRHRGPGGVGGGGLTARERAAYLKEEYQKMWDAMQEEFQQLLADLLQVGGGRGRPTRRPGRGPTRQGVADGAAGGGGGQEYGALGGVRSLLSDLNPVHFLEQLAALAERTADLAESALGGGAGGGGPGPGGGTPQGARPQPQPPQQQQQTQPQQQQQQKLPAPRRPPGSGRLTFGFDVTIPGLSGDQAQIGAVGALRSRDNDARGYTSLLQRALGDSPGSVYLLPDVYLPVLRLISGAEELLRLPPDLQGTAAGGGGGAANGPATSSLPPSISSSPSGPPLVSSWIQHYLDEVVLEQLLPQVWVELRGRCTAALEDAEAFRAQVGFSAAAASAATLETAAGGAATAPAGSGGAAASATTVSAISLRSVVPIARFIEVVLQELMASAAALPPFTSAFLAIAERILDRMLGAFMHVVRLLSADCPSTRLVSRSDVCLAMAAEGDALLLREPVAFAPQPNALPGAAAAATATAAGGGSGTSASASDLVGFLVSLRSQERPVLVPPQVRPLGTGGGGRGSGYGFAADGDTAEVELQYFAMRERPVGHERLVFGQGGSDRAVHLAAMSESLDYVAEAVIRLTANVANEAGGGGSGPQRGGDLRRGSNRAAQHLQPGAAIVPDLLLPAVQSYKALSGHCCRLLRLEALLLVGSHLAPVAATSHVCEEVDSMELHPSLGALTRAALRSSEDLTPFLQPAKRAYVLGPIAVAAARGIMWLLPAIHDISSLGVERMIRALSLLQPPLTSLVDIESSSGAVAAIAASGARAAGAAGAGGGASAAAASGTATGNAAVAAAAAAAALATAVPTVSGPGPSAGVLAALLVQPETRGERGRAFDKARTYYGLLLVPPDEVVRAATERPGRFLYAEWMALLQARVPHRTVTDLALGGLQRCLDRAYGLTPGAKVAEVVGAVVGAVQAPAERLGDVLLEGLVAGKDALLEGLVAGRDTLVAGVRVPAQTLQRVFKRIGAGARGGAAARSGAISGNGGDGGVEVGSNLYRQSTDKGR